jgi:hypothetical protein
MTRRLSAFALASALLAAQFGCRTSCGSHHGLFTSCTREAPCQTVGLNGGGCFDAATGQPCPCPTEAPGVLPGSPLIPGAPGGEFLPGPGGLPEGPPPAPSDMIRPPAPAIPLPAPGDASLPFPSLPGTPVKIGPGK